MKQREFMSVACLFVALIVGPALLPGCSMQKTSPKLETAQGENAQLPGPLQAQADRMESVKNFNPIKVDYLTPAEGIRNPEIYVYKEKRRLYVVQSNVLVRDYPVGLGFNPNGDKQREGDGRTPEGDFWICVKNPESRFGKSVGISYPNKKHAERAFFAGFISPTEFRDILLAMEMRGKPPWNTSLGGEIFIHSGGAHKDWTQGCIALYDSDMDELFRIASVGTPVSVRP